MIFSEHLGTVSSGRGGACLMFLDQEWVRTKATYMQFPTILKSTRQRTAAALRSGVKSPAAAAHALGVDLYAA